MSDSGKSTDAAGVEAQQEAKLTSKYGALKPKAREGERTRERERER